MDMDMTFYRKLPIPKSLKETFPADDAVCRAKKDRDPEIRKILKGESERLLLVIGPCSADNEDAVLEYSYRLAGLSEKVKDKIWIVPRVYTNKPRSKTDAYKGLLHQPDPEGKPDMLKGLIAMREIHQRVIRETGLTCADEMLYPESFRYVSDLLSYAVVGARSSENQEHRLVASGAGIPVGFKNPTGGNTETMIQSVEAAEMSHTFIYRGWEVKSAGNPYAHGILRGYTDVTGRDHANYKEDDLKKLYESYQKMEMAPCVIVDTNHANSGKNCLRQSDIAKEVVKARRYPEIHSMVRGLMIESYLEDGAQKVGDGVYGKSITDPCLGWEKTERLILDLAEII